MRKGQWMVIVLVLLLGLTVSLAACRGKTTTTTAPTDTTAAPTSDTTAVSNGTTVDTSGEDIRIGQAVSLTGPSAAPAEAIVAAVEEEVAYLNANGGWMNRTVKLIVEDDKSDVSGAVAAVTKLVEQDKVDAVLGPFPQFVESAARAVTEKAGVPNVLYVLPTLASEKDSSFKWTFLCTVGPTAVADALVKLMTAEGYKNVVAIADNLSIHQESLTLLRTSAPAAGITVDAMSDTWGPEETDTSAVVAKLAAEVKAKNPDAILVLSSPIHAPGIQKQLRALGVKQQIVGGPAGAGPAMFAQGPQDAEGMLVVGPGTVNAKALPDDFKPKADMVAFGDRLAAANKGQPVGFYAGFGYDSLYIVLNAMRAAGGTDKAAVRDAIEKTTGWQGMQGIFNYSATDHVGIHGGLAEWRIENGGFEFVRDLTLGQ